ncbi:PGA biosynthesis protein CapA [Ligilactobacillus pabuli]|uniref:PGA biosynthesis protein CapA n=1 Tax=Ligilactobacillus pabuli TaxID=2886039 RepID=A0ABQ5JGW2_9LACO|nr:CapA family protein [Ligilactobacillus pabuli]GKS81309.1 PGA biosynthesis protein CapA [Ligilactobacillus pabuli]
MAKYSRTKQKHNAAHKNKHGPQAPATRLLPPSTEKLTFKQKIIQQTRYRRPLRVVTLLIVALCLFFSAWVTDYLHNQVLIVKHNISLTSRPSDRLQLSFVGDVMLDRGNARKGRHGGYDQFFTHAKQVWRQSDLTFANLENVVTDQATQLSEIEGKNIHFKMDPAGLTALQKAGFTTVGVANNHVGDYGEKGVRDTMAALNQRQLDFAGLGENTADALKYQLYDIDGIKVSFLAVTDVIPPGTRAKEQRAGMLTTTNDEYLNLIQEAAAQSDYTVVYAHWGNENGFKVNDRQQKLGHQMTDAGADLVVGMHSHVVQPIEKYKNGLILYSLGNFVFEQQYSRQKDTVVANLRLDQQGKLTLEVVPMRIKDGVPTITRNPFFKQRIYHQLTKQLPAKDYSKRPDSLVVRNFGYHYQFKK